MSRAFRPGVEVFEPRVVLSASHLAPHVIGPPAHPAVLHPGTAQSWTSIALRNDTGRSLVFKIVIKPSVGAPTVREERLASGGHSPWRHAYPQGGTFPKFTVSFETIPGNPRSITSKDLYPTTTTFEPSREYIIANSFTYKFTVNPNGTISLVPTPR